MLLLWSFRAHAIWIQLLQLQQQCFHIQPASNWFRFCRSRESIIATCCMQLRQLPEDEGVAVQYVLRGTAGNECEGCRRAWHTASLSSGSPWRLSVSTARKRYSDSRLNHAATAAGVLGISNMATTMLSSGVPVSTDKLAISFVSSRAIPLNSTVFLC